MSSSRTCTCSVSPVDADAEVASGVGGVAVTDGGGVVAVGLSWAAVAVEFLGSAVSWLESPEGMGAQHSVLEERLEGLARENYRLLYQAHLDERAVREVRLQGVVGADAVTRTRVEVAHERDLDTVFGTVVVARKAYRAVGASNLHPADSELNLPVGKHSHGVGRLVALEAARDSFAQTRAAIGRYTAASVGKRQIEQLARAAAVDVDAFYAQRRPDPCEPTQVLVLQVDGKGIVMTASGLREATARAAATASGKLSTRLSPGEKAGRKRMAEVGAVHDLTPVPRTVDDIIAAPQPTTAAATRPATGGATDGATDGARKKTKGPVAKGKWLTASVTDDIPAVIGTVFDEAERRDPSHARDWVALVDGNAQQISTIQAEAAARGVSVPILIDFVHVIEYVWKAAWTFYFPGQPEAEVWVAAHARAILNGDAPAVATAIRAQADAEGFRGNERKNADAAAGYLTTKAAHLDYPTALARGWPIATGVIEGACRHLIKDRMDITGARWGLDTAEAILKLRAVHSNGDFNDYWQYHLTQEHHRNHQSRYQDKTAA
jgi:hypothetical protein